MPKQNLSRTEYFRRHLLSWHKSISRPMPWKGEKDPYKIWVSEIMLQQTRVDQAKGYFLRFMERFPTVYHLAQAEQTEVLKYWEGLGYYRRARHLLEAANSIVEDHSGIFPEDYRDILSLKGIGSYTAAAIASFAFDQPFPVIDGNVERIIARYQGIEDDVKQYKTRKIITDQAEKLLDKKNPGKYNQAIMDFGAIQCTPTGPDCNNCPIAANCISFREGTVSRIPNKRKSKKRRNRYFHYVIVEQGDKYLFSKRKANDVWSGMYEFPLVEKKDPGELILRDANDRLSYLKLRKINRMDTRSQVLSHQKINMYFYNMVGTVDDQLPETMIWDTPQNALQQLPLPKTISCFLKDKSLHLKNI